MIDFQKLPSPCFVLDEQLLDRNLAVIDRVRRESGAEVIVALKACAMWSIFPELAQHSDGATASSLAEARLVFEEFGRPAAGVSAVPWADVSRYCSLKTTPIHDNYFFVDDMIEKPKKGQEFSNYSILGRVLLTPEIYEILHKGSIEAEKVAAQTLKEVKDAMKINYFEDQQLIREQAARFAE